MFKFMKFKKGEVKDISNKKYIFEFDFSGKRVFLVKKKNKIKLFDSSNKDILFKFPSLQTVGKFIEAKSCVIDGWIVFYNESGAIDVDFLNFRDSLTKKSEILTNSKTRKAVFVCSDIVELNGKDLTNFSLMKRKEFLENTVIEAGNVEVSYYHENGKVLWDKLSLLNYNGIFAKEKYSKYYPGKESSKFLFIGK